jgi:hypothetical protein
MNVVWISVISWSKEMPKHEKDNFGVTRTQKVIHVMSSRGDNTDLFLITRAFFTQFLEQGQTLNQRCYSEILARLHEIWILFHDNVPAHACCQSFMAKKSIMKFDHAPWWPDLALCTYSQTEDLFEGPEFFRHF